MSENVLIIGAGIAGLGAAMALSGKGRKIAIYDRDPPPPPGLQNAFEVWERKGVTQLRHSHVFLGALVTRIRHNHPKLHKLLTDAGAREIGFQESLPPQLRNRYTASENDREMAFLFSRRTTLEHVMRAYVEQLPGVTFHTDARVKQLIVEKLPDQTLLVAGVNVERDNAAPEQVRADIVVDACGRNSLLTDQLREHGAVIEEDRSPAGILYFTRHYRLRPGQSEPPRDSIPGAGDLGYIKFGVFAADNDHFSITLAVPEIETELRQATLSPAVFDRICMLIPGAARWIDPARAEPVTKVFGMGNLFSVWRHFVKDGRPQALNFFAVGDAAIRTNPLYGRGCSIAVMHADILAQVLNETPDPQSRALRFAELSKREIRPFWTALVKQDLSAIRRAQNEQQPGYKPRLKARLIKSFADDAVGPATRSHLDVYREIMKGFHMLTGPAVWLKNPWIVSKVLWTWMLPKAMKKQYYQPKLGPGRTEMLTELGLNAAKTA